MNRDEIQSKLTEQIAEAFEIEPSEVLPDKSLVQDLGAESIDLVDLTFRIEKTFGIDIPEDELFDAPSDEKRPATVDQLIGYISSRLP